ncbi:MAG: PAC2 family protein [Chloroflexi bacterium]|nr:PAC2 family protein [Chloroflexota bacterium]
MRIGKFELVEPLPELRNPHVIASLTPWIDAGSVGSLSIERIERFMDAQDLGKLATPGTYFDFTHYRPIVYFEEGERRMKIPNADMRFARGDFDHDFIFLHMLEPHSFSEEYIDALVEVLTHLNVQRFCRIGAMYDAVPHTRPLLVMGTRNGEPMEGVEGVTGNRRRPYQGPTSIMNMVGERLVAQGVESMMLMARLPHYVELEADFAGRTKMLQVLSTLYSFPPEYAQSRRDTQQYERVTSEMSRNPQIKSLVERLESDYDARRGRRQQQNPEPEHREDREETTEESQTPLPPSVEQFLGELGNLGNDNP